MKLQWSWTINHVQNQPNLCWVSPSKFHINPSFTPWSQLNSFWYRILQPWIQNIYGWTFPNSLYTILYIRDTTVDKYSIFNSHWPKSVEKFSLGLIRSACINMIISIVAYILMLRSAASFWCESPAPLNLIYFCFFNSFSVHSKVFNIPLPVWYPLIITPWIWYYRFNNTLYRV